MTKRIARTFRFERIAFYLFLAFYLFHSQVITSRNNDQEIYPFFQWSLHSTVESTHKFIHVRLTQEPHGEPCLVQNCPGISPLIKNIRFYFLVQDMGRVHTSNPPVFEEMRGQLEAILKRAGAHDLKYELIEATARPREFANNGAITLGRVIYEGAVVR